MERNIKTYCFDFDGTVADTLPLVIGTINRLLKESGEKEIDDKIIKNVREYGIENTLKKIGISPIKMFFLVRRAKLEMNKNIKDVNIKEGMEDVLKQISNKGHCLGILTSNSRKNVVDFLKESNFPVFDFVATSGMFNKERVLKKLKKRGGDFVYIGDEVRDIIAGKAANVSTIGVNWGLSSEELLSHVQPDMIAEEPKDILSFLF